MTSSGSTLGRNKKPFLRRIPSDGSIPAPDVLPSPQPAIPSANARHRSMSLYTRPTGRDAFYPLVLGGGSNGNSSLGSPSDRLSMGNSFASGSSNFGLPHGSSPARPGFTLWSPAGSNGCGMTWNDRMRASSSELLRPLVRGQSQESNVSSVSYTSRMSSPSDSSRDRHLSSRRFIFASQPMRNQSSPRDGAQPSQSPMIRYTFLSAPSSSEDIIQQGGESSDHRHTDNLAPPPSGTANTDPKELGMQPHLPRMTGTGGGYGYIPGSADSGMTLPESGSGRAKSTSEPPASSTSSPQGTSGETSSAEDDPLLALQRLTINLYQQKHSVPTVNDETDIPDSPSGSRIFPSSRASQVGTAASKDSCPSTGSPPINAPTLLPPSPADAQSGSSAGSLALSPVEAPVTPSPIAQLASSSDGQHTPRPGHKGKGKDKVQAADVFPSHADDQPLSSNSAETSYPVPPPASTVKLSPISTPPVPLPPVSADTHQCTLPAAPPSVSSTAQFTPPAVNPPASSPSHGTSLTPTSPHDTDTAVLSSRQSSATRTGPSQRPSDTTEQDDHEHPSLAAGGKRSRENAELTEIGPGLPLQPAQTRRRTGRPRRQSQEPVIVTSSTSGRTDGHHDQTPQSLAEMMGTTGNAHRSESGMCVCDYVSPVDGAYCGVGFHRMYDLYRHRTIHAKEEVKAIRTGQLNSDRALVLGKEFDRNSSTVNTEWRCESCGTVFSRKDALLRHKRVRSH